ncbi:hypothetical protein CPAR01_02833 [Colletotrichum paranaense]|uniref:Uncharacterized protein n=1 Tax=Colletotrichum paranaense TaxID=1914294 RepID=A0ABQ9T2E0_9PEZI|nr:uncharacterized protein CPAR01_02833 [Colletotrichum paranaense]KAK1545331.1 hypothetical protein CPAR01_02833 [Colletotrichum paranaense]
MTAMPALSRLRPSPILTTQQLYSRPAKRTPKVRPSNAPPGPQDPTQSSSRSPQLQRHNGSLPPGAPWASELENGTPKIVWNLPSAGA